MQIQAIRALKDNYIWLFATQTHCLIVDPGESANVQNIINTHNWENISILITHHHYDHTAGLVTLLDDNPSAHSYGPNLSTKHLRHHPIDTDHIDIDGFGQWQVIATPGHTLDHLCYYKAASPGILLCGDTLFSAGCGRVFEGTSTNLYNSLQRLRELPEDTLVYAAHEYTLDNLAFATCIEPENSAIYAYKNQVNAKIKANLPSLPSRIGVEHKINPFFRCSCQNIQKNITKQCGIPCHNTIETFIQMRKLKDKFYV